MVSDVSEDSNNRPAVFLYGKNTLSRINRTDLLEKLEDSVPGNKNAKVQLLLMISQAYANKDFNNTSAVMLTGNSGVGKSSIIKSIGELTNIPIVRLDLETLLETGASGNVVETIQQSMFETLYDDVYSIEDLTPAENKIFAKYKRNAPKGADLNNVSILREKPNAEFTIVELDNSEVLLNKDQDKNNYSRMLQLTLVDQIKKPIIVDYGYRNSKNFIYVFSSDLGSRLSQKNVGFRMCESNKIDNKMLIALGYSKRFVDLFDQIITLEDLNERDFEQYLLKEESFLHRSICGLASTYGVNVTVDDSAIKVVSKYLANNKKNLKGIEEVTRKLLAPHYISPKKGTKIVIDSTLAAERLYAY